MPPEWVALDVGDLSRTVRVIGGTDTGKTTFVQRLVGALQQGGGLRAGSKLRRDFSAPRVKEVDLEGLPAYGSDALEEGRVVGLQDADGFLLGLGVATGVREKTAPSGPHRALGPP